MKESLKSVFLILNDDSLFVHLPEIFKVRYSVSYSYISLIVLELGSIG